MPITISLQSRCRTASSGHQTRIEFHQTNLQGPWYTWCTRAHMWAAGLWWEVLHGGRGHCRDKVYFAPFMCCFSQHAVCFYDEILGGILSKRDWQGFKWKACYVLQRYKSVWIVTIVSVLHDQVSFLSFIFKGVPAKARTMFWVLTSFFLDFFVVCFTLLWTTMTSQLGLLGIWALKKVGESPLCP